MNSKRNCAERMRPILQAMERSIEELRRKRTHQPEPNTPPALTPKPVSAPVTPTPSFATPMNDAPTPKRDGDYEHPAQRLKAKPKRMDSSFSKPFAPMPYRSQTG